MNNKKVKKISFPTFKDLSFSSGKLHYNFRTAIITGACRSGKTTLGTLLATCNNVENAEEPWTAKILPLLANLKGLNKDLAKDIFLNFVTEFCNETILLRTVSFRPDDASTILNQKTKKEISNRFSKLKTRKDVNNFKEKYNPLLLLNLTEVLPFVSFFFEVLPDTTLINVIRKGKNVAKDCFSKRWFSDRQLLAPIKALPYQKFNYDNQNWHIPWWVNKGDEKYFISLNEYNRCIYYWCQNIEAGIGAINQLNKNSNVKTIQYEKLIKDPEEVFSNISTILNITPGPLTDIVIKKIKNRNNLTSQIKDQQVEKELELRMDSLNNEINSRHYLTN